MSRLRTILSWLVGIIMAGVFIYGMIRFPDNPIRPCHEHGYCGKQGQPHSYEDFVAFSTWDDVFDFWPVGIVLLILLNGGLKQKGRDDGGTPM